MDSVSIIDSIAQIIIILGVCVVLPVLVVWLVSRSRKNDIDRRTEVMLKAIEHGQEIDPEAFSSKGKGRRTIKMALLGKLQTAEEKAAVEKVMETARRLKRENLAGAVSAAIVAAIVIAALLILYLSSPDIRLAVGSHLEYVMAGFSLIVLGAELLSLMGERI